MKLSIDMKGMIWDEDTSRVIAVATEDMTEDQKRTLEAGIEAIPVIKKFVEDVNNGSLKPRSAVKDFEKILDKLN